MARHRQRETPARLKSKPKAQPTSEAIKVQLPAEKLARDVRALLLDTPPDAGLALCDLLLEESDSEFDLPSSAWRVLVRLMREWRVRGERGMELYYAEKKASAKNLRFARGPAIKSKKSGRQERLVMIRQWLGASDAAGEASPITRSRLDQLKSFLSEHAIPPGSDETLRREIRQVKQRGRLQ